MPARGEKKIFELDLQDLDRTAIDFQYEICEI